MTDVITHLSSIVMHDLVKLSYIKLNMSLLSCPFLIRKMYPCTAGLTERVFQYLDGQARVQTHNLATFSTLTTAPELEYF